jgi:hypothetical protein
MFCNTGPQIDIKGSHSKHASCSVEGLRRVYINNKNARNIYSESTCLRSLNSATGHFKKCKQLFKYQHLLLLRDIWWSKF